MITEETLIARDLPECPLLDGSLAFSGSLRLTISLPSQRIEVVIPGLKDFYQCLRFLNDTEGQLFKSVPSTCTFGEIFGHVCTLKQSDVAVDLCQGFEGELFIVRTYTPL